MTTKQKHPIELLRELERRSKQTACGLPRQSEHKAVWSGIGFRIGNTYMITPLTQVNEILHYPKLTLVPGTLPWVKGLANIRGTLLPVMDLQDYLEQPPIELDSQSRIMIIQQGELTVGLLVNEVFGLRHFEPEEQVTRIKKLDPIVKTYIRGAFHQGERTWHLFDISMLVEDPQFYKVAI
jgi:twitching motility protein PilI